MNRVKREETLATVQTLILDHLSNAISETIRDASVYSITAGGKRFRPYLLLSVLEAMGEDLERGVSTAAALEMIHTYSLIHDDLPAMDDDDLRRGQPTNHIVFGEAAAILAGDNLLTESFHIIINDDLLTNDEKVNILRILAEHAGQDGMISGQMLDIEAEQEAVSMDALKTIHELKTGALIKASVISGCIIAHASESIRNRLIEFSDHLGVMFQIRDDILDVTATAAEMGKLPSDEKNNKATYVSTYGLEGAKERLNQHYNDALQCINLLNDDINNQQLVDILNQFT